MFANGSDKSFCQFGRNWLLHVSTKFCFILFRSSLFSCFFPICSIWCCGSWDIAVKTWIMCFHQRFSSGLFQVISERKDLFCPYQWMLLFSSSFNFWSASRFNIGPHVFFHSICFFWGQFQNISFHGFANVIQIYLSSELYSNSPLKSLLFVYLKTWMKLFFLFILMKTRLTSFGLGSNY